MTTLIISDHEGYDRQYAADVALEIARRGGSVILSSFRSDAMSNTAAREAPYSDDLAVMPWAIEDCQQQINEIEAQLRKTGEQ